jgi:hypothetical protein
MRLHCFAHEKSTDEPGFALRVWNNPRSAGNNAQQPRFPLALPTAVCTRFSWCVAQVDATVNMHIFPDEKAAAKSTPAASK